MSDHDDVDTPNSDDDFEELADAHRPVVEVVSESDVEEESDEGEEVSEDDEVDPSRVPCDFALASLDTGDIDPNYCCAQFGDYIALGTGNDRLIVWNFKKGLVVLDRKFTDSVTHIKVFDGRLLAAGDMAGKIEVYETKNIIKGTDDGSEISVLWECSSDELTALEWHPSGKALLSGTVKGDVWVWQILESCFGVLQSGIGVCVNSIVLIGPEKCLVAYHGKQFALFDVNTQNVLFSHRKTSISNPEVVSIAVNNSGAVAVAGCSDGTIAILSLDRKVLLRDIDTCLEAEKGSSIESVLIMTESANPTSSTTSASVTDKYLGGSSFAGSAAIRNSETIVAASVDGKVFVYTMASCVLQSCIDLGSGVVKMLKWPWEHGHFVAAICLNGHSYLLDVHQGKTDRKKVCHHEHILDFCILEDKGHFATCSEDGSCKVFDMYAVGPAPIVEMPAEE